MSTNALFGQMSLNPANPTLGVTGTGVTFGNSYGTSTTFSPGLGNSAANGAANGFGNSTATQIGGVMTPSSLAPEITFGSGFGNFAASGGSVGVFGSPFLRLMDLKAQRVAKEPLLLPAPLRYPRRRRRSYPHSKLVEVLEASVSPWLEVLVTSLVTLARV
jgi:hypothetical protein